MPETFASPMDATRFCKERLADHPALVFYIMIGEEIVDTVMNSEYHELQARRQAMVFSIVSTVVIALAALAISAFVIRFETLDGHAIFVAVMVILYLTMLVLNGARNVDGAIFMAFVLLLAAIAGPPIKKLVDEKQTSWRSDGVAQLFAPAVLARRSHLSLVRD